jgi:hypothetical protein
MVISLPIAIIGFSSKMRVYGHGDESWGKLLVTAVLGVAIFVVSLSGLITVL